jgi:pyruvate/2-oxoglutarate dehydrogenase complex dihydrolipoamide dehydrogenase (E3) component
MNMAALRDRKRKMVVNVVESFRDHYYTKSGAELVMGTGCFVGPKTIEVALSDGGTPTFRGKNVRQYRLARHA